MAPLPAIGRIVHFRSRTGKYTVPAMITCNIWTLNLEGVQRGLVATLTAQDSVHLTVFTPGLAPAGVGSRAAADDFVAPPTARRNVDSNLSGTVLMPVGENLGGTYQEWDVPFWDSDGFDHMPDGNYGGTQPAGTWTWPGRSA
jgi:hypothetical protein